MKKQRILASLLCSVIFGGGLALAQQTPPPSEPPAATEPATPVASQAPAGPVAQPPAATPPPSVGQTAQAVVQGVTAAATESAGTMAAGGKSLADQGRGLWSDILLPLWQRLASAVPGVVKAVLVLLIFWVVAVLVGAGVRKALGMTRLDDRAVEDWGLGGMLTTAEGKRRSLEGSAGSLVKWLILLVGFVAFFQALDLAMVAGPLQGIVSEIVGIVPNLLQAALILLVVWIIASLLRLVVSRGLGAVGFDEKAARFIPEREVKGETVRPSGLIGKVVFYVVLLFGLPPFLDALGQRALVSPLSDMLDKILAFLPNVVAAALIFLLGHVIATVVREVVTNLLAAAGADAGARRLGLGKAFDKLEVSKIAGAISYFFIIVPVIGAAVDSLGIRAVSEPVTATLETILAAVPLLFVAGIVVGVGYFLARIVSRIVGSFLEGVGFDLLPEKLGLDFLRSESPRARPSAVVASVVMVAIILLTAQQALATIGLTQLSDLLGRLMGYLPQVVVALVVIFAALVLSAWAGRLAAATFGEQRRGRILTAVTRYAILFFGFGIGLNELGVGEALVTVAVAAVLGGAALALGLAFGLGGREHAKRLIEETEGSGS